MKTLVLTCNVRNPYACLVEDGQAAPAVHEADYVELVDPYAVFPENAVARVVGGAGQIDRVVFLGKPLLFLERLVSLHGYLFPRSYRAFGHDLHSYIETAMRVPALVRKAVEENDLVAEVNYEPCYYVRLDDALANAADCGDNAMIVTCLTDTYEGPSFCCFERKQGQVRLAKELDVANSFGNLLRIHAECRGTVSLDDLVDPCDRRVFTFRKRALAARGNALVPRVAYAAGTGKHEEANAKVLATVLPRLLGPFTGTHDRIVMIVDVAVPKAAVEALPSVEFRTVDEAFCITAAHRYVENQVAGPR